MAIRVDFSGRSLDYTEEETAALLDALRRADTLTQGRYLAEFQNRFAAYLNLPAHSCFAVMNGVSALELSAQLCLFEPGDEVVIPSHTFTASAYPFVKKGAVPVWADIDPSSRVVTAESIEAVLSPRTRAVVVVHLYGYAADMPSIMKLACARGLTVIEDAAQSVGAEVDGTRSGAFGDMSIFSFHSHKNLTTLGEGGMLVVRDKRLADLVPMLRHNGHCAYPGERADYWTPAMGNVDLPMLDGRILWPNNYCIGEMECAMGIALLERIDRINAEKRARALRFIDALAEYRELEFHRVDTTRHNYHLLAARVTTGGRDDFIRSMYRDHGVKCVVQYMPLNRYDFYAKLGFGRADCPHADAFYDNMVSFPFQHRLTEEEFDHMLAATKSVLKGLG
jgi:dTDP-4-amino-4,6-dideoxygalactose transaminase